MAEMKQRWAAKDVCGILGHSNHKLALQVLNEDEKGVRKVYPIDGTPVQQLMWKESILTLLNGKHASMN